MRKRIRAVGTATAAIFAAVAFPATALAAGWITPDYEDTPEPDHRPIALYWFDVKDTPYVYRTELTTPAGADRVTALARSSGYLYVWVDGERVWTYSIPEKKRKREKPDPSKVHGVDLTPWMARPGKHTLAVSAPKGGFVLAGGFYSGTRRLKSLATDKSWRVIKLPPTTIIEDLDVTRSGYAGGSAPVKEGEALTANEDDLARVFFESTVARVVSMLDEARWRLELLAKKGIYIADDDPAWWGGPRRTDAIAVGRAREALRVVEELDRRLDSLKRQRVDSGAALEEVLAGLRAVESRVRALFREAEGAGRAAYLADERKMLELAGLVIDGRRPDLSGKPAERLKEVRAGLEKRLGHPLNRLNESRYDRLGWIARLGLSDDQIGAWGVRVNPVTEPTSARIPRRWFFSTDPKDSGLRELRWTVGYNIEGQWPRIRVPMPWQNDGRFKTYRGIVWYRTQVHVPGQWAGNDIVVKFRVADTFRLWFNEREITKLGTGTREVTFKVPVGLVSFGGDNYIAARVVGKGNRSGIIGKLTVTCPALGGPEAKETPPADVLSTPLSPCVVLEPKTDVLQIHHGPGLKLVSKGRSPRAVDYRLARDGRLPSNWVMLWRPPTSSAGAERPILLVFQTNPLSITGKETVTRVRFATPRHRVIAVRPWVKARPPKSRTATERTAELWSRAALAVPVNYANITRVLRPCESIEGISVKNVPKGPLLGHTVIYDYLVTKDEWGTQPLRLAPLPALCSYGLDTRFRNLELDQKVEVLHDGGMLAPYRGLKGADRVSYRYDVEPYARRIGFTSWVFAHCDTGVRGNWRETELLAATGSNSFRPQHNFGEHESPHYPGKTRVRIMVDACLAVGLNYTNNIDQTLGKKREYVREHYDDFVGDLIKHYDGLTRQLKDEPFWVVGYDLINEAFDHYRTRYNPALKRLTASVRAVDPVHLCYIEPCESWGAIPQLLLVEPTGDPLTLYSFHDYHFRLKKATDRWPNLERDITDICRMWMPAFKYAVMHGTGMHCGEFGGFHGPTFQIESQKYLMSEFFRIFDQFGIHSHYYTGRDIYERSQDGCMHPSNVIRAYRKYMARPDVNLYYKDQIWPTYPDPNDLKKWALPVHRAGQD